MVTGAVGFVVVFSISSVVLESISVVEVVPSVDDTNPSVVVNEVVDVPMIAVKFSTVTDVLSGRLVR